MKAWLKKAAGYLAAFFAGVGAALAFIVLALLRRGSNFKEDEDAPNDGPLDTDADLAEAAKRAAIQRAIDRARERSATHNAYGAGASRDTIPGD